MPRGLCFRGGGRCSGMALGTPRSIHNQVSLAEVERNFSQTKVFYDNFYLEGPYPQKRVKVFLWSIAHRALNTHEKLQRKCPNWSISPSVCCLCLKGVETLDHLFLHCPFATKGCSFYSSVLTYIQACLKMWIAGF